MRWARDESLIAVDWGTSNRRAWRLGPDGIVQDEMADDRGVTAIGRGGFEVAVREIRDRLGELPILLAGMAGSTHGWVDAPYVPAPVGLAELAAGLVWAEPGRSAIVPGVCFTDGDEADVMRGEEVQLLGAAARGLIPTSCIVCHPGTHNKWVEMVAGRVQAFRTVMTGEIFALAQSSLMLSGGSGSKVADGPAFRRGVRRGLRSDLVTRDLFAVRAQHLLGRLDPPDRADFASGILIGADVAYGLRLAGERRIEVMGSAALTALYAAALEEAGHDHGEVDGRAAFLAGARAILEMII